MIRKVIVLNFLMRKDGCGFFSLFVCVKRQITDSQDALLVRIYCSYSLNWKQIQLIKLLKAKKMFV